MEPGSSEERFRGAVRSLRFVDFEGSCGDDDPLRYVVIAPCPWSRSTRPRTTCFRMACGSWTRRRPRQPA